MNTGPSALPAKLWRSITEIFRSENESGSHTAHYVVHQDLSGKIPGVLWKQGDVSQIQHKWKPCHFLVSRSVLRMMFDASLWRHQRSHETWSNTNIPPEEIAFQVNTPVLMRLYWKVNFHKHRSMPSTTLCWRNLPLNPAFWRLIHQFQI